MSNRQIEIRDFVTDDYPAVANIRNTINPDWGDTPEARVARTLRWVSRIHSQ